MNQNQKRIVIIEGDAFDADAIVAIVKTESIGEFDVYIKGMDAGFSYVMADDSARDKAMAVAVHNWRESICAPVTLIPVAAEPLPDQPPPQDEPDHWADENGRFYETYSGKPVYFDGNTGERFIWNEGPPRRKNPLGEGASPILKTYVDEAGKPLDPQPI